MNFSTALSLQHFYPNPAVSAERASTHSLKVWARRLSASAAAALLALGAQAQDTDSPAATSGAAAAQVPAPAPRYAASDLERAFGFMDGDRDGKVSRQEASGFRGVAKNFDRADTNHDGFLSREEFDTAMNYVKPN